MLNLNKCIERTKILEQELEEMTTALSQSWDQLVPFLQDISETTQTKRDVAPILQAISVAADCEIVGIYLFERDRWYSVPEHIEPTLEILNDLKSVTSAQTLDITLQSGGVLHCAVTPIVSENEIIGVLGVASRNKNKVFTAVDFRILSRMGERFSGKIAASQLAELREREAVQAREMQIANEIQQSVQPITFPKHDQVKMASYWKPAKEIGGDAWGWIQQENGHFTWFILDVAGKGLPAAIAAVALHTAISMALRMTFSPSDVLKAVNEEFYDAYTRTDLMATVAILSLNPSNGELSIANAGHPPILIRHANEWLQLNATAPPIGVLSNLVAKTQTIKLMQNDLVISYSDGFSEVELPNQKLWGQTGILNAIPNGITDVKELTKHLVKLSQDVGHINDDQTLVSVTYKNG